MSSASDIHSVRKILVTCLVIFVAIFVTGLAMKISYTTKMNALASCTGTGCLTYGEQSLGFIRYFLPFLHIGAWGCGLSFISLAVLKIKGRTIKNFDIKKSIKISGIVLAFSLLTIGTGFTLGTIAAPMVQLGTVGVGASVVYIACSSYTYKQIARSRSDQKDEPHP